VGRPQGLLNVTLKIIITTITIKTIIVIIVIIIIITLVTMITMSITMKMIIMMICSHDCPYFRILHTSNAWGTLMLPGPLTTCNQHRSSSTRDADARGAPE
jgi:hypothetical protein